MMLAITATKVSAPDILALIMWSLSPIVAAAITSDSVDVSKSPKQTRFYCHTISLNKTPGTFC